MKLARKIHPGDYNLLSYISQIPGAIYIAGTLPLDASLLSAQVSAQVMP